MQKAAQSSQLKNGNLGRGRVAYAFKISRVNPDFVSFKIWILGYYSKVCSIAVASLPKIVAQIDTALADGEFEFELGDIRFSADEKLLKSIREELSSYCCSGVSDANNVPVKPSSDSAESVKKCGAKPKASAPATEQARQLCKEELDGENHSSYRRAGSCGTINDAAIHCAKGGSDCTAPSASQVRSACGAGVVADVSAIRADLAEMRESQADFFENLAELLLRVAEVLNDGGESAPKQPRGWQKCAVENPLGGVIRTKRGRTSAVVGVRKVSTPKKQK